jgi:cytochrome c-type biogenesis protein
MLGIDIFDASLLPAILVSLLAGLISFLSPCVLPIVPPYLDYMSGISLDKSDQKGNIKVVLVAASFVLGLSTVFLILGIAASSFGILVLGYQDLLNTAAGLLIMCFGLHFLGIIRIPILNREVRFDAGDQGGSFFGAYLLGLAFAFGWTPCIGPQLGAILSLAASEASVYKGIILLGFYALGLGIPFLIVATFFSKMGNTLNFFKHNFEIIERVMGLLLWTVGLLMLSGGFTDLSFWLLETFPSLGTLG